MKSIATERNEKEKISRKDTKRSYKLYLREERMVGSRDNNTIEIQMEDVASGIMVSVLTYCHKMSGSTLGGMDKKNIICFISAVEVTAQLAIVYYRTLHSSLNNCHSQDKQQIRMNQ